MTEKSITVDSGSFSEMQDLTEIFGMSSTIDMDSSREPECSETHCVIFLVDSKPYQLSNPMFGVKPDRWLFVLNALKLRGGQRGGTVICYMDIGYRLEMNFSRGYRPSVSRMMKNGEK